MLLVFVLLLLMLRCVLRVLLLLLLLVVGEVKVVRLVVAGSGKLLDRLQVARLGVDPSCSWPLEAVVWGLWQG